ncbi:MAG TPA: hypothetical protein VFB62_16015 [Polyangiaceae bacterium]|nr:hypothetical protein [Polyangiaceae bacterium]
MSETELFHSLSEARLRSRALWGAATIILGMLMPYEAIDGRPQFIWQLFDELPLSSVIAGVAPALAGLAILIARWRAARAASLAIVVLGALALVAILHKLGTDAAAWGLLPLPPSFTGRTSSAIVAMSLTAAGAQLAQQPSTRRAAKILLCAAVACAAFFYLWPGRGEAPGRTIVSYLAAVGDMPTLHFQVGAITLAMVASWPAIIALMGLVHLRWPPSRNVPVLTMVAPFGFPIVLMFLLFSWYLRADPGSAFFGAVGAAAELTAVLALCAAAFEVLGQRVLAPLFTHDESDVEPRGWSPMRTAAVTLGVLSILVATEWVLARPPDKGVRWTLGASSAPADELFGKLVVTWSDARWIWDLRVREDSSASELIDVKSRGRSMVDAAGKLDRNLGSALHELERAGTGLDVSSRAWYRMVDAVNTACRDAELPYYLDPRVTITKTKEGLRRRFIVDSYRVVRVRRFDVDGAEYATLHVRGFGTLRGGHALGLLGFSRDVQPFALVVLDSTDDHFDELLADGRRNSPRCAGLTFDPERDQVLRRCGEELAELTRDEKLREQVVDVVERHEIQHQIDGPLLPLARPVLEKLAGYYDEAKDRVNRELSAHVAQLTAPAPHVGLVIPLRFVLLQDRGTYHHAAVLMFEALGDRSIRDESGDVIVTEAAAVYQELAALSAADLAARAATTWKRLFGDELPTVTRKEGAVAPGGDVPSQAKELEGEVE